MIYLMARLVKKEFKRPVEVKVDQTKVFGFVCAAFEQKPTLLRQFT